MAARIGTCSGATIGKVSPLAKVGRANGLSKEAVVKAVVEALDAHIVKAMYDKDFGEWRYSEPLVDHSTRLTAAELAIKAMGWMPAEKRELSGPDGGPIQSEGQLAVQAGSGIRSVIERLESSGIAGPGPEDAA